MSITHVREKHEALREQLAAAEGSSLAPSRIAGQFYCEKKVALTREHGDVETPAKMRGSETHEKAAEDSERVSDDEFWNALESGEQQVVVESPFIGEAADFLIGGVPDAVLFEEQQPRLVFERKTTSRPNQLYKNQRIQAWLYGFILDSLGFDTSDLQIAILSHERSVKPEAGKKLQQLIIDGYDGWEFGSHELVESPKAVLHLSQFSKVEYVEDFDWALGYWREEREARPTETAGKCQACEYNDVCPDSQA